jgi:hypothetical protein
VDLHDIISINAWILLSNNLNCGLSWTLGWSSLSWSWSSIDWRWGSSGWSWACSSSGWSWS